MRVLVSEKLSQHKYKTPEGYLICTDAILARTGKQQYLHDEVFHDGSNETIDLDRPYDEVFNEKTLASFENKPITIEHPQEDVNVGNYKDYSVGYVRDVRQGKVDGTDVIIGNLVITDQEAIDEVESGNMTDLSCGYDCDVVGSENAYKQANIRGNHVALCKEGRAGCARIIDSATKSYAVAYHGTSSDASRRSILNNGFTASSVFFNTNKYDAEGYGRYIIKCDLSNLKIYTLTSKELEQPNWYDKAKYSSFDGIAYNFGGDRGTNIEVFNVSKLNAKKSTFIEDSEMKDDAIENAVKRGKLTNRFYNGKYGMKGKRSEFEQLKKEIERRGYRNVKFESNPYVSYNIFFEDSLENDVLHAIDNHARCISVNSMKEFNEVKRIADSKGVKIMYNDDTGKATFVYDNVLHDAYEALWYADKSMKGDYQTKEFTSKQQMLNFYNQHKNDSDKFGWWLTRRDSDWNVVEDIDVDDANPESFGTVEQYMKQHNLEWREINIYSKKQNKKFWNVDDMQKFSKSDVIGITWSKTAGNVILHIDDSIHDDFGTVEQYMKSHNLDWQELSIWYNDRKHIRVDEMQKLRNKHVYSAERDRREGNTILFVEDSKMKDDTPAEIDKLMSDISWKYRSLPKERRNNKMFEELKRLKPELTLSEVIDAIYHDYGIESEAEEKQMIAIAKKYFKDSMSISDVLNIVDMIKKLPVKDYLPRYSDAVADKVFDILDEMNIDFDGDIESGIAIPKSKVQAFESKLRQNGIQFEEYHEGRSSKQGISFFDSKMKDASIQEMVKYLNKAREGDTKYWIGTDGKVHWKELASIGSEGVFKNTSELKEAYEIEKEENGD